MSLEIERASAAERRHQGMIERTARAALHATGQNAPVDEIETKVRETWQRLSDAEVAAVLAHTEVLRRNGKDGHHRYTPQEIEMAVTEATEQTRAAILELLKKDRTLTATELWERCQGRGLKLTARSSFEGMHCSWARKQLGINGLKATAAKRVATREAKSPSADHPWRKTMKARPAGEDATPTQPSEEVAPSPPAHEPPPAADTPLADNELADSDAPELQIIEKSQSGSSTRESEGGSISGADCLNDCEFVVSSEIVRNDWTGAGVKIVSERLEVEIARAQRRVTELRIALDVVEGLSE